MNRLLRRAGYFISDIVAGVGELPTLDYTPDTSMSDAIELRSRLQKDYIFSLYNMSEGAKIEFRGTSYTPVELLTKFGQGDMPSRFYDQYAHQITTGFQAFCKEQPSSKQ